MGEGDPGRADPLGECLYFAAEQVLRRDPGLVLAHVSEERPAVDVADRIEPLAATDPQAIVAPEEAVLARLAPGRVETDLGGVGDPPDRHQDLGRLNPDTVVQLSDDAGATGAHRLDFHPSADV